MGSFDCYCALCTGPLGMGYVKLGRAETEALRKRRTQVNLRKRELAGEPMDVSGEDVHVHTKPNEEAREEAVDISHNSREDDQGYEDVDDNSDAGSMDSYDEKHSYDPQFLTENDFRWLDKSRALGFNEEASSLTKAFITGHGSYGDYGGFEVDQPGNDSNDTRKQTYPCYTSYDPNESPVFPFHDACFQILTHSLGYKDTEQIDKDALYTSMAQCLNRDYDRTLDLDYGDVEGAEQFWDCISGEEYSVCNPAVKPDIHAVLQNLMPAKLFSKALDSLQLSQKVQCDIFEKLPYDVLYGVFEHLPFYDTVSLMQASWHVFAYTRDSTFWKQMMRLHTFPWFWEVSPLLKDGTFPGDFDYKGAFLWLHQLTTPAFGMTGPFMGIANRRRIWNACQDLVPAYRARIVPTVQNESLDEEAKAIFHKAKSLHMPLVAYPQQKSITSISAQFIRSWDEIEQRASDLETYWNDCGALIGIAVRYGSNSRLFGNTNGIKGDDVHIEASEWIRELIVDVEQADMFDLLQDRSHYRSALDNKPARTACIQGMTVTLSSGRRGVARTPISKVTNLRCFAVLPGMHLIGLTGQAATDGMICRLGLLQSSLPGDKLPHKTSYTGIEKLLWTKQASSLAPQNNPIWEHPSLRLHQLCEPSGFSATMPNEMVPWDVLLWADTAESYKGLQSISCFLPIGGHGSDFQTSWPIPDIVGLRCKKIGGSDCASYVGTGGPVPAQCSEWGRMQNAKTDLESWYTSTELKSFDNANMNHFDIDGPGGEVITEVHISNEAKALRLLTNRGRGCFWGEENRQQWTQYRVGEDELIVGLVCAFGNLGGWSWGVKMYSHWNLSGLAVITAST